MEKYRNYWLPPFVYLGPLVHIAEGIPRLGSLFTCTSVNLVLFGVQRFVFIFGGEFYFKLVLFTIYLRVRRPFS